MTMQFLRRLLPLFLLIAVCWPVVQSMTQPASAKAPVIPVRVVARWPHDPAAFTQGLVYADGTLYESTGLLGQSSLRQVDVNSGLVTHVVRLPGDVFGEGLAAVSDRLVQLTWRSGVAYVYDRHTFERLAVVPLTGEGWGLAYDGARLIQSDGTATLRFRDPDTFVELSRLEVRDGNQPITRLNELEVIDDVVYANVWMTDRIAVINLTTGQVQRWLDLSNINGRGRRASREDVLNGIAYDTDRRRLLVTGKRWATIFEIEEDVPRGTPASP